MKIPQVALYSAPGCSCFPISRCGCAGESAFKDIRILREAAAAQGVCPSEQQGVPVLDFGGKIVIGLGRKNRPPALPELIGEINQ
jgi:hypothetical protein